MMRRASTIILAAWLSTAVVVGGAEAFEVDGTLTHLCDLKREPGKIPVSFKETSKQNPFIGVWHGSWIDGDKEGMMQTFAVYAAKEGTPFIFMAQGYYAPWNAQAKCQSFLSAGFDDQTVRLPTYKNGAKVSLSQDESGKKLLGRFVLGDRVITGEFHLVYEASFRDEAALRAAGLKN